MWSTPSPVINNIRQVSNAYKSLSTVRRNYSSRQLFEFLYLACILRPPAWPRRSLILEKYDDVAVPGGKRICTCLAILTLYSKPVMKIRWLASQNATHFRVFANQCNNLAHSGANHLLRGNVSIRFISIEPCQQSDCSWYHDGRIMDVTKSWTETEMDGQRGPDGYPNVIKIRCKVCSEFRLPVFWHFSV